jgi:hypothetical protein
MSRSIASAAMTSSLRISPQSSKPFLEVSSVEVFSYRAIALDRQIAGLIDHGLPGWLKARRRLAQSWLSETRLQGRALWRIAIFVSISHPWSGGKWPPYSSYSKDTRRLTMPGVGFCRPILLEDRGTKGTIANHLSFAAIRLGRSGRKSRLALGP